jgi:RNA polymerase sigma-70 factor (ECF subfamily)
MSEELESDRRERMTRHWLAAEPAIRAYIAGAVRPLPDREDLLQQVALTVARRFEEYDEQRSFLGWALWIAKSRVIDFYRSHGRQPQLLSEDLLDRFAETLLSRQADFSAKHEALEQCMEQLPDQSRSLLRLKYQDGLRIEHIASILRSTPGSVRVTLFRVREALAECIDRRLAVGGRE